MSDQPPFRFYPNAYAAGGPFKASSEICDACARAAVWLYTGVIYMKGEAQICARCIADGTLTRRFPDAGLQDVQINGAEKALEEEVLCATPGVASFNPFEWPVIKGKPLAFMGVGDDPALKRDPGARKAIAEAFEGEPGHGSHVLVFKQIDGPAYVAVLDLD